jgi:hypothetical protein
VFSHAVHGKPDVAAKVNCESCHALALDGNRSRTTAAPVCLPCHTKDTHLAAYDASVKASGRPARTGSPPPLHRIHAAFPCDKCHSGIRRSAKVGDLALPPLNNTDPTCVQCHGKAVRFSHAVHVSVDDLATAPGPGPAAAKSQIGAACTFCHPPTPQGVLFGAPGHAQCWSCHDIALLGLTEGCNLCHLDEVRDRKDYNIEEASLRHKEHPSLKCADCHAPILTARTLGELKAARDESAVRSCARCHNE